VIFCDLVEVIQLQQSQSGPEQIGKLLQRLRTTISKIYRKCYKITYNPSEINPNAKKSVGVDPRDEAPILLP
jgi:hypothetical protein